MHQYLLPTGLLGEKDTASVVEDLAAILEDHTCTVKSGVFVQSDHPVIIAFCQSILADHPLPIGAISPNGKKPTKTVSSPLGEAGRGDVRNCEQCGKEFLPKRKDSRHCSKACQQAAFRTGKAKEKPNGYGNGYTYELGGENYGLGHVRTLIMRGEIEPGSILTRSDGKEMSVTIDPAGNPRLQLRSDAS